MNASWTNVGSMGPTLGSLGGPDEAGDGGWGGVRDGRDGDEDRVRWVSHKFNSSMV